MSDSPKQQASDLALVDLESARSETITLQREKRLVAATRDPKFMSGIEALWSDARGRGGIDLLRALALMFRICAVARNVRPRFQELASLISDEPSAVPGDLSDSDDRRYLADGFAFVVGDWRARYFASGRIPTASQRKSWSGGSSDYLP